MKPTKPSDTDALSEFDRAAALLEVAKSLPPAKKVKLGPYHQIISELLGKGYSYGDIGDFLTNELGREVSRSKVFGFVKRNPSIFDLKIRAQLLAKPGDRITTRVTESDAPASAIPQVFRSGPLTKAPSFSRTLPLGLYLTKKGKLYRVDEPGGGPATLAFVRNLPKKVAASLGDTLFMLGKYVGSSVRQETVRKK